MRALQERRFKGRFEFISFRFAHRPLRSQGQQDRHRDGLPRVTRLLTTRINAVSRSTNITQSPQLASAGLISRGYCSLRSSGRPWRMSSRARCCPRILSEPREANWKSDTFACPREAHNSFPLKFTSGSKRSNFENRTKSPTCRASEKDGPFGE
jgi:hypothetical protein